MCLNSECLPALECYADFYLRKLFILMHFELRQQLF